MSSTPLDRPGRRLLALLAAGAAISLAAAADADAAFPGANGRIAFVNATSNGNAIFSVNPDGSGLLQLTSNPDGDDNPAWSADGARIAFTRNVPGQAAETEVWVMNADGSGQAKLTSGDSDCDPAFLRDGRVVFVRGTGFCPESGDIWLRNLDGTEVNLTPASPADDIAPASSPDGQTIAFARGDFEGLVLHTVPVSGGPATPITDTGFMDNSPNFSPDGRTIAFDRCDAGENCSTPLNIASVPAGGGAVTLLTANAVIGSDPDACQPAYAPDGTTVVFTLLSDSITNCNPLISSLVRLAFVGPTGGAVEPSVEGFAPDWQPLPPPSRCLHRKATISGTDGRDRIIGTPGDDVIKGFKGKDKIKGKGGDDVICGQRGEDRLFGNGGDDVLMGGKNLDFLKGGPGKDHLFGGTFGGPNSIRAEDVCVAGDDDRTNNCRVQ